jgi:hypothetical protein
MLIEFLGDAKLATPGTGCRSWPVAPVSQDSFARRMRIVMQDTARWDGIQPWALARGSDRCAPPLPSSAHEEWPPSVLVEPRATDGDEKNCETNPITSAGILAKLAWRDAERYGCRGEVRAHGRTDVSSPPEPLGDAVKREQEAADQNPNGSLAQPVAMAPGERQRGRQHHQQQRHQPHGAKGLVVGQGPAPGGGSLRGFAGAGNPASLAEVAASG